MSEQKTAKQIADEIPLPRVISSGQTLKDLMIAAIEADRAQRPSISEEREALEGVKVTFYRGESDNAKVVQIDTDSDAGKIRVNLNDGPALYEGDPEFDSADDGTIHAAAIAELENDLGSNSCHFHGIEAWINDYPNDFWERYAQPMIEQIKADFT